MASSAADGSFLEDGAFVFRQDRMHAFAIGDDMAELVVRIGRARRRASLNSVLRAGLVAVAAGLAAFSFMRLGNILFGMPQTVSATAIGSLALALLLFAGGVCVVLLRPRSTEALARKADRQFGLEERVSTVLALSSIRPNVVERALIADIGRRANRVDPDQLVPFRLIGLSVTAAALAACAIVLSQIDAEGASTSADTVALSESSPLTAQEGDEIGDELRRVAALVQADADRQADPYLAATARGLAQLAEDVGAGVANDRAALADQIDQLRDHAAAAYQLAQANTAEAGANRGEVEESLRAVTTDARSPTAGNALSAMPTDALPAVNGEDGGLEGLLPDTGAAAANEAPPAPGSAPEPIIAERDPAAIDPDRMVQEDICNAEYEICETENVRLAAEAGNQQRALDQAGATPNAVQRAEAPGGMLLGPANEADRGDAALAGEGTRPLGNDGGEDADGFAAAGEMLLPDRGEGNGNYITLNAPTPLGAGQDIEGAPGGAVAWQAMQERAIGRALLATSQRDVVARYFRTLADTAE